MRIDYRGVIGFTVAVVACVGMLGLSNNTLAARFTSGSYIIDASVANSFGGSEGSTNYKLVGSGGESLIGDGSSGSYKMSAGYVAQLTEAANNNIELTAQPSNLVAYYPLDEPSGTTVNDFGVNQLDGATVDNPSWTTGKLGGAIGYNGTSQYISVPDNANFSPGSAMTISLWANQFTAQANKAFVSMWDYEYVYNLNGSWALQTAENDASALRFFVAGWLADYGDNYVDTPIGSWNTNAWNHVVVVYDGSLTNSERVKIYINGNSQTMTTVGTIATSLVDAPVPLIIGDFYGLDRWWNGSLDHVKLFSRAMTAAEVKAEYDAQNAGIETGLTLGTVTPGASNTSTFDVITRTDSNGYNLSLSQNHDLQSGAYTVPAVGGSIASPAAWSEGTTKGLGFSLVATNATAIPGKWSSGDAYAAIPATDTTFYNRTGVQTASDYLSMRLRLDTALSQAIGDYSQTTTIIGTMTP